MQEQITAALKKTGHPLSPAALAKTLGVAASAMGYHVKNMLEAGTLKAAGKTAGRRIGLPDHDFAAADETPTPPQRRKKHRKAKHGKKAGAPKPRAARAAAAKPAERFIPTVDAQSRLVIVNGGEPHVYSEDETTAIASLLFQHYDKEG